MLQHCLDLAAGTRAHGLQVEGFPQLVDGMISGPGSCINEDADVRVQDGAESLEEPTMRIDLLLVLLLKAKHHLDGDSPLFHADNAFLDVNGHLRRVLFIFSQHMSL